MSHRPSGSNNFQDLGEDDGEDYIAPPVFDTWMDVDEERDEEMADDRQGSASRDGGHATDNLIEDVDSPRNFSQSPHSPFPTTPVRHPRPYFDADEVRRRLRRELELSTHSQTHGDDQEQSSHHSQPRYSQAFFNRDSSSSTSRQLGSSYTPYVPFAAHPNSSSDRAYSSFDRGSPRRSRGRSRGRGSRGSGSRGSRGRGPRGGSRGVSRAPTSALAPPPLFPSDSLLIRPPSTRESAAASRTRVDGNCIRLENRINTVRSEFQSELNEELNAFRHGVTSDIRDYLGSLSQGVLHPQSGVPQDQQSLQSRSAPTVESGDAASRRSTEAPVATSSRVRVEDLPSHRHPDPQTQHLVPLPTSSQARMEERPSTEDIGRIVLDALYAAVANLSSPASLRANGELASPTQQISSASPLQQQSDSSLAQSSPTQPGSSQEDALQYADSHRPLLDRISSPPSEPTSMSPVVWLGPYEDRFPGNFEEARSLLAQWSGDIVVESQAAVPIPRFVYVRNGGRYLRLVFCTAEDTADPVNAEWFMEMWNSWAPVSLPDLEGVRAVRENPDHDSQDHVPTVSNDMNASRAPYSLVSWNIDGNFEWGMLHDDFRQLLLSADVILIQETHHYEYEEAIPPEGFLAFSCPRASNDLTPPWGGVATFVRPHLKPIYREEFSGPDFIGIEIGGIIIFNVYILPHHTYSDWTKWTDVHPFTALEQAIALATELGMAYIICGDINARTGSRCPDGIGHPRRSSADWITDTRGRSLLEIAQAHKLVILNGSETIPGTHSSWTYCKAKTDKVTGEPYKVRSVIDYAISSTLCLPFIQSLTVSEETPWSDHNFLCLELIFPGLNVLPAPPHQKRKKERVEMPLVTHLDHMFHALIHSEQLLLDEELDHLYGRAISSPTFPIKVYSDGSCITEGRSASAGSGIYFGPGNPKNLALRATGHQTNNCGELYAILAILHTVPGTRALEIYTDSHYVIRSLVEWAPMHAKCGWAVPNGQLIHCIATGIESRCAPIAFRWVRGHSGNIHNENADALALEGAYKALPIPNSDLDFMSKCFPPRFIPGQEVDTVPKVSTDLPPLVQEVSGESRLSRNAYRSVSFAHGAAHRGRSFKRKVQRDIQQRLLEASEKSQTFWRLYKKLRYPHSLPCQVSVQQLFDVFVPRMNPPDPTKCIFDTARLRREDDRNSERAPRTPPSRFPVLNEPVSVEDVAAVKAYLKARKHSNATGTDEVMYTDILTWDNQLICELLNECFNSCDSPGAWMTTLIAAIPKVGKDATLPSNYRTIALESCFLKFATLLVAHKFTTAAESANILPKSQNGFRAGYRTNNNAFILRALIDKVRSSGQSLYVAFVDISNAFPSTNQSALWNRLEDWGFTGPYFDWLRSVYSRMRYLVSLDGELSPEFAATSGVLIGDPASPLLWILYLAMFSLPFDPDDADLLGTNISHLEHADDMVIISRTAAGLQRHLHSLQAWCYTNFLSIAVEKTKVMVFHPSAAHERTCPIPVLCIYDKVLKVVEEYKYVGISFSSVRGHMFDTVYDKKRRSALAASHGIFGTERLIGRDRLFPHIARSLYTALVDCHLIYGCDVVVDTHMRSFSKLHEVQLGFLRRLLGLGKRSMIAVLYTETGVLPLRTRRLILALKYLDYLLSLPLDQFASLALRQCMVLYGLNTSCWVTDLQWAVSNLPGADGISFPMGNNLSRQSVQGLIRSIRAATCRDLQSCIDQFSRLSLLRGRLEPVDPNSRDIATYRCVCVRHYLTRVLNHHYRRRLTQLLCGALVPTVFLASPGRAHRVTDDVDGLLCRACGVCYETPEHVLLCCDCLQGPGRDDFLSCVGLQPLDRVDALTFLKRCIFSWDLVIPTARFIALGIDAWMEYCEEHGGLVDDVEGNVVDVDDSESDAYGEV